MDIENSKNKTQSNIPIKNETPKPAEEQKVEFLNILQQKLQEKVPEKTGSFENVKLSRQNGCP